MSVAGAAATTVAACRLGNVHFAVPMNDVAELVDPPDRLIALPRRDGALLGAFTLHDTLVPVVDLRRWLRWPGDAAAAPAHLLVLRQGARRLAVGIDTVDGLQRVHAAGTQRLDHGAPGDEVFGSAVRLARAPAAQEDAPPALGLLDVAALMRLAQVWAGPDDDAASTASSAMALSCGEGRPEAGGSVACAWLHSDGRWLALPVAHLRAVVAMPALQPLWQSDPARLGVARWRDRDVPVMRLLRSLGIGGAPTTAEPWLAVVEHDGLCTGIPVDAVRDVLALDPSVLQPVAALGIASHPILSGLWTRPDGSQALCIDVPAWLSSDPLAALGTPTRPEAAGAHDAVPAHVVVQAGGTWALPISALRAIIEAPDTRDPGADPQTPWCHTWRRQSVPIWDLRALKGRGPTPAGAAAKVLILQSGALPTGLLVESLLHLLPARGAELHEVRRPDGRRLPFLVHRDGEAQHSFALLEPRDWPFGQTH